MAPATKHSHFQIGALLLMLLVAGNLEAKPLGIIPTMESNNLRFILEWRSDLWTSLYENKNTPSRIYNFNFRSPVFKTEAWSGSVNLEREVLSAGDGGLDVGNQGVLVNTEMVSESLGFGVNHQEKDQSSFSLFGSYESATEDPYKSSRDSWTEWTAIYAFAPMEKSQWIVMLNESKNRGFLNNQTIPIFGFLSQVTPEWAVTFGFPFLRIGWNQQEEKSFSFVATPVGLRAEYLEHQTPKVGFRYRAGLSARSYLHSSRVEDDMRLIYEEKYLDAGVKVQLTETTSVGVMIGGSFDRSIYEAKQAFLPIGSRCSLGKDIYGGAHWEFQL